MKKVLTGSVLVAVFAIGLAGLGLTQDSDKSADGSAMSIDGTYILKKRVMADNTVLTSPDVGGMMTFTRGHRQLEVFWKNADGSISSRSMVSEYELSDKAYDETASFLVDQNLMGEALKTTMANESGTGEVTVDGTATQIKMPLFGEPIITVTPDGLTADMHGQWVDYWEKLK